MNIFRLGWWGNSKVCLVSFFFTIITIVIGYLYGKESIYCKLSAIFFPMNTCEVITHITVFFIPVLFFSIIYLFIKNKSNYNKWRKFTFIYFFIYLFTYLFIGTTNSGTYYVFSKETIAVYSLLLYSLLTSVILIRSLVGSK
jgi:hypothetical protein